jgi:hypothetical protein
MKNIDNASYDGATIGERVASRHHSKQLLLQQQINIAENIILNKDDIELAKQKTNVGLTNNIILGGNNIKIEEEHLATINYDSNLFLLLKQLHAPHSIDAMFFSILVPSMGSSNEDTLYIARSNLCRVIDRYKDTLEPQNVVAIITLLSYFIFEHDHAKALFLYLFPKLEEYNPLDIDPEKLAEIHNSIICYKKDDALSINTSVYIKLEAIIQAIKNKNVDNHEWGNAFEKQFKALQVDIDSLDIDSEDSDLQSQYGSSDYDAITVSENIRLLLGNNLTEGAELL